MAEQVQAVLDQMVAPLADLMDRNIFTQSEIHAIVARRRESEYLIRRLMPRKADFLKYIQDELNLEQLRQLRTKRQRALERERLAKLGKLEDDSMMNKKHLGDTHIVQHIHLLFRRALRKYNKEDVSIYLQYADVCKQLKSFNKLPEIYAEAVQIHPREPGLWIEAASHEFFHRQSVSTARVLLQRGLRVNKKAKDLWLQSFALEFHHIAKMQGRRAILQLDDKENEVVSLDSPLYAIAKIVFDNAIEAISNDVSFRLSFLDLCKMFPFTDSMKAYIFDTIKRDFEDTPKAWIARANHVLEQKKSNGVDEESDLSGFKFAPEEEGSSDDEEEDENERPKKKRRTKTNKQDGSEDPVVAVLCEAIETVNSPAMIVESTRFAWGYWECADEVFSSPETIRDARKHILNFIGKTVGDAARNPKVYTTPVVLTRSNYFIRLDKPDKALEVLEDYVDSSDGDVHSSIWLQLASLTLQIKSPRASRAVLRKALKRLPLNHPDQLKLLLENLGAEIAVATTADKEHQAYFSEEVKDIFQRVLLLAAAGSVTKEKSLQTESEDEGIVGSDSPFGISSVADACCAFLLYCIELLGPLKGVREACRLVMHQSKYLDPENEKTSDEMEALSIFFDKCVEVELSNTKQGGNKTQSEKKKDKLKLRQLYEKAISVFRSIPPLADKYQQGRNDAFVL